MRDIGSDEIAPQSLERWPVQLVVHSHCLGTDGRSLALWHSNGKAGERSEQRTFERLIGNQVRHLRWHISQRDARRSYAALDAAVEQGDRLIDDSGKGAQSRDDVGVILDI